jgi:hypothetical protein
VLDVDVVLLGMAGLFGILVWSGFACARSYYERGRIAGMQEAVRELQIGMSRQLGAEPTAEIRHALARFHRCLDGSPAKRSEGDDPVHAQLWVLGAALAEECWLKGHGTGVRRRAPEEGRTRIDLTVAELLQLGGLANVGFQHMMPNARIIDIRRFTGSEDALEASRSISKIEASIPRQYRPDLLRQADSREHLIDSWWKPAQKATA